MTGRDNFDRIMRQRSQGQPKKNPRFSGYLGITTGGESVIDIPNRAGFVWVRLRNAANEVIQAFNDSVSPLYNLPVLVERDLSSPIRYKIIGVDRDIYGGNWGTASSYIPNHGAQHSFNRDDSSTAGDITWIYTDQFLPLLVAPSGSSGAANVIVYPYLYHDNGGNYFCAGNTGTATLLGNLPTGSSNARMSLVYLDVSTGNPMILAGTDEFANTITGTCGVLQYIPGVPDNDDIALAGVRLITGTSTIRWENLYDIREFIHKHPSSGTSGGGGSGDNTLLIYDDSVFKVTGTAISFDDNLEVAVTGSIAYVDCGPEVLFSLVEIGTVASPHISLDVLKGHTAIRARNELRFYTSGSYVGFETPLLPTGTSQIWVLPDADGDANEVLTTDGGGNLSWSAGGEGATGSVGPSGDNTLLIYDDSVFKVTGTAISFDDNLLVHVTGSYAYVDWTGSGGDGNVTDTGEYGSEPGAPSEGDTYLPTDAPFLRYYDGADWNQHWGLIAPITPPPTAGWSWDNQNSATVTSTNGVLVFTRPPSANNTSYYRTAPSVPYTVTIGVHLIFCSTQASASHASPCWRQSADGKHVLIRHGYNTWAGGQWFHIDKCSNHTTGAGSYLSTIGTHRVIWYQLTDDNTNRIIRVSYDGINWHTVHTVGRTDYLTADEIGITMNTYNNVTFSSVLFSWREE